MNEIEKVTGYFKSFDGTPIYFESRGRGKPIILAYGIVCTTNHWHHQVRNFSQNYRVIMLDYRGHHQTPKPSNLDNLTIDALAQDLLGLCKYLDIDKASVWGHSFGAQVVIRAYDMLPSLFENIVFINGFASNPFKGMFGTDISTIFQFIKEAYSKMPETSSYLWRFFVNNPISIRASAFAGGFNPKLTSFKDIEIYGKGVANIDVDVAVALFNQMIQYDGRAVLSRVGCPALIIGGTIDKITPPEFQKVLHREIPSSELIIAPYGTHCCQLDLPSLVNLSIEKFLRKNNYV